MQHIVSVSFSIDDEDICARVKEAAAEEAVRRVKKVVDDAADEVTGWRHWDQLVESVADRVMDRMGDEIVDKTVSRLTRNLPGRKAFIEAVSAGVLADVLKGEE